MYLTSKPPKRSPSSKILHHHKGIISKILLYCFIHPTPSILYIHSPYTHMYCIILCAPNGGLKLFLPLLLRSVVNHLAKVNVAASWNYCDNELVEAKWLLVIACPCGWRCAVYHQARVNITRANDKRQRNDDAKDSFVGLNLHKGNCLLS